MINVQKIERIVDQERAAQGLSHLTGVRPEELIKRHLSATGLQEYLNGSTDRNEQLASRYLGMAFRDLHQTAKQAFDNHFDGVVRQLERNTGELNKFLDATVTDQTKNADFKARMSHSDPAVRDQARDDLKAYLADKMEKDPSTLLKVSEYLSPHSTELAAKLNATNQLVNSTKNQLAASMYVQAAPSMYLNSPNPIITSLLENAKDAIEKHPILTAVVVAAAVNGLLDGNKQKEDEERRQAVLKILDEKEASNARLAALEGSYPELSNSGALDKYKSSDPRVILTVAAASAMATKAQEMQQKERAHAA